MCWPDVAARFAINGRHRTFLPSGNLPIRQALAQETEETMNKPIDPRQSEEMAKKKPGNLQDVNPPKKTSNDNPERNPRDQKGRGGSK
jgi:hypothetical protein